MKSDALAPRLAIAFSITLALYLLGFYGLEHRRHVHGPWTVQFDIHEQAPCVVVSQPDLGITNVTIRFPGGITTNATLPQTMVFDSPGKPLPFGESPFADLTFLPGTVTLRLWGHTVELIPRVLAIDGQEYPWKSASSFECPAKPEPRLK